MAYPWTTTARRTTFATVPAWAPFHEVRITACEATTATAPTVLPSSSPRLQRGSGVLLVVIAATHTLVGSFAFMEVRPLACRCGWRRRQFPSLTRAVGLCQPRCLFWRLWFIGDRHRANGEGMMGIRRTRGMRRGSMVGLGVSALALATVAGVIAVQGPPPTDRGNGQRVTEASAVPSQVTRGAEALGSVATTPAESPATTSTPPAATPQPSTPHVSGQGQHSTWVAAAVAVHHQA